MIKNLLFANALKLEFVDGDYAVLDNRWRIDTSPYIFTRLYYIYAGSAVVTCNGESITMLPGNLYLLPKDLPISYYCPESMEQLYFHITLMNLEGFDILANLPKVCQLPCSQEFLTRLKELYVSPDYCSLLEFKLLVTKSVLDCLQNAKLEPIVTKSYSQDVLQAISYIQSNVNLQLTTNQIAKAIFISPNRLHKIFKAETGMTIGAYLDRLVLFRSTQLLKDPKLSIGEISRQLGFCDQYYFSRRFKNRFGQTPSEFRRNRK
ncbi:MAG: helix-turn-helix transcriptional regulator [Oscillospiraceae bacterium]|nr:helix-turn-helix transcriptional regulator [Oscillospiraceae bacterium]